jgi:dihydrolipoamide dehydrogenase
VSERFDVVVVGGGPGGYVAAIRCAQLGLRTAVVERERLGGVCLNWGCIPTKALLRSAEVYRELQRVGEFGLSASGIGFDLSAIVARSRAAAKRLEQGVRGLLRKNDVGVFAGNGRLAGAGRVDV